MSRDKTLLHPKLQQIIPAFLTACQNAGLNVLITECFRTKSEQDALYAQGRTAPGKIVTNAKYPQSAHCWGVAFDFCRNVKGREYDNSDNFFQKVGAIGKKYGLTWGGDWKNFVDMPHFELAEFMPNASTSQLQKLYGLPENFMATWNVADLEPEEEPSRKDFVLHYKTVREVSDAYLPYILPLVSHGIVKGRTTTENILDTEIDMGESDVRLLVVFCRMLKRLENDERLFLNDLPSIF